MKAYYIPGTHWDREWYEPFQEYRMWLVQNMDEILTHLTDNDSFPVFHLDGQGVLLEDYLEIRPEMRPQLSALLAAGRLVAGPWYAMPDLWLVSGEALIRNFNLGMQTVRNLGGEPMRVGYSPDLFGHIAAMPMLFAGLGFKGAVVWRGLNDAQVPAHFIWVGPDGSRMLTLKLPDHIGYGWFGGSLRWPWTNAGHDDAWLQREAPAILAAEARRSPVPLLYLSDAGDHQKLPNGVPEMLEALRQACPEITFVHDSLETYFDELAPHRDHLPEFTGELRQPAHQTGNLYHALIPHCLASRLALKQANDRCQNLLTWWAEPLAAIAIAAGQPIHPGFLSTAWKWLLKNQPHDSICGCSIDETHADMAFRFHQAELIGDGVRRQAMARLSSPADGRAGAYHVVVWNPLPWARTETCEIELLFPADFPAKGMRSGHNVPLLNQFDLVDPEGQSLPYQVISVDSGRTIKSVSAEGRRQVVGKNLDLYRIALPLSLPACGFTSLTIRPLEGVGRVHRQLGTLRTAPLTAENETLILQITPAGTAELTHKESGQCYRDLFQYEDSGDAGDGWNYVPPLHNPTIVSPGQQVQTAVEVDGPLQVTFRIDRLFRVPSALDPKQGERRASDSVELRVTDYLTLRVGDPMLHLRTVVDNSVGDHRLRVLLPSDIPVDTYWSDQPFAWVERPVSTDPGSSDYKEPDPPERPHHTAFALAGESGGLAVLCPEGLHEHAVIDDARRTLALTLFRGVGRTPTTDGEPGAQSLGRMEMVYALLPFAGAIKHGAITRRIAALQAGIATHLTTENRGTHAFLNLEADDAVVCTALMPGRDGCSMLMRLWNTSGHTAAARITLASAPTRAWLTDLREEPLADLSIRNGGIEVTVPPRGLSTIAICHEPPAP